MTDLFSNPERPFFRSTSFLKISKIDESTYRDFILNHFRRNSISISEETVSEMLHWTSLHTWYVQLLCNRVYLAADQTITGDSWKEEASRILKEQEYIFYGYREMLTIPQWELLKAIARESEVYQPTSTAFLARHSLGNPSTVLRSLKSLLKMELIYLEYDKKGESRYGIYDVLFGRWIERTPT